MTMPDGQVNALLLDLEGTVTSIDFVYQVLFPYARRRVGDFLERHAAAEEVRADLARLREEWEADERGGGNPPAYQDQTLGARLESTVAYLHWLMDRDRKSTPLKSLQGKIWEEGYRAGELKSRIFADVPAALERWHRERRQIAIFSSGSVLAQQLFLAHTEAGDLTGLIGGYFDTRVGTKSDPESYRRIAGALRRLPAEIVFISDVTAELQAARAAGMQPVLSIRPGNHPQPDPEAYPQLTNFDDLRFGDPGGPS
ncbi:MAG TPA: acireductone synthase [Blastocatellia bacterium]|nr:acireductone synthase [Blastocatellia bacterium]